jgi:colicin import membrane protein
MNGFGIDQNFNRNFIISLVLHGAFIAIAFLGAQVMMKMFKNNDIEIIKSAVRVDVIGMPKFTVQELKALEKNETLAEPEVVKGQEVEASPKEVEVPDIINKDDLVLEEVGKEKKRGSFMNIVSDYSAKKVDTKVRAKGKNEGLADKNLESLVIEGNRLSQGSALVGGFSDEGSSEFAAYVQSLPEAIRQFWKLPSYLMDKDLRCRIKIYLSSTGQLVKLEIFESSGQAEFDARAERAVRDATPFPRPADALGKRISSSGIILGFPL